MSGIEVLAIAASVVQVADMGARLSVKLYTFARKASTADRSIQQISQEIAATGAALRELGEVLEDDTYASLGSKQSIESTNQILADCRTIFVEINQTIGGDSLSKGSAINHETKKKVSEENTAQASFNLKQRLKFPFIEQQVDLLRSKLESLKTALILMLQVLSLAEQIRKQATSCPSSLAKLLTWYSRPKVPIAQEQQDFIQSLVMERNALEKRFDRLMKALEFPTVHATHNVERIPIRLPTAQISKEYEPDGGVKRAVTPPGNFTEPQRTRSVLDLTAIRDRNFENDAGSVDRRAPSLETQGLVSKTCIMTIRDSYVHPRIHIRQEEIEHHATLVSKLLDEIGDMQYRIDHGIRDRMHKGVLKIHWDEWSPLAKRYGSQVFMKTFDARSHMGRYWLDQEASETGQSNNEWAIDLCRPTYIKVNRKHLSPTTLDYFRLPWQWDTQSTEYIIIKKYIDHDFQEELFEHTRRLQEKKLITSGFQKDVRVTLSPHGALVGDEPRTRWTRLTDKVKSLSRLPKLLGQKTYGSDEEDEECKKHEVDEEDMGSGDLGSSLHDFEDDVSKKNMVVEPSHPLAQPPVTPGAGRLSRPLAEAVRKDQDQMYLVRQEDDEAEPNHQIFEEKVRETFKLAGYPEADPDEILQRKNTIHASPDRGWATDEVQELLLSWTDLTTDEMLEAGLGKHDIDRRKPGVFA